MSKRRKRFRKILRYSFILILLLNVVAFLHAYSFTHFSNATEEKTPESVGFLQKVKLLFTGINNPRPKNTSLPTAPYKNVFINSTKRLACWLLTVDSSQKSIILFHGYGGEKSSMLDKAYVFRDLGYSVLLVDFAGSGGSEGSSTTIGYDEAEQVKDCYNYVRDSVGDTVHLFGTSMGAVAIMKAISNYCIQPTSIILECPFGTMYQTVKARFNMQGVPAFPMAPLLVFWGGAQHGFWAFGHNPVEYAKTINCPTLLLYGEQDPKVSRKEIAQIHSNLVGPKRLVTYPLAGHENYLTKHREAWTKDVSRFLGQ